MTPRFVIAGRLSREYLLPPSGRPLLDAPGGNLLYTAGGLRVWEPEVGLLGRVGEDYPRQWLQKFESLGMDTSGIRVLPGSLDLRTFLTYSETFDPIQINPVTHFARREMTFPKTLLGYQAPPKFQEDSLLPLPHSPSVGDIPRPYQDATAVHLCPMDFITQSQLAAAFKAGSATTVTLDSSPGYMIPKFTRELRVLLNGLTAFLPSQDELRSLFWGITNDLWEMIEALGSHGCEFIVVKCGGRGQLLYDALGKHRFEIPAYDSRVVDPTGAGDAFCGGFLAGYRKNYDPLEAVLHGSISASFKVEGSGAFYPVDVMPGLADARLNVLRDLVRTV